MSDRSPAPYERPLFIRFGSFRELTRIGPDSGNDISAVYGIDAGCDEEQTGETEFGCSRS